MLTIIAHKTGMTDETHTVIKVLGWFVDFVLFMWSSFPIIYWALRKAPPSKKLTALFS